MTTGLPKGLPWDHPDADPMGDVRAALDYTATRYAKTFHQVWSDALRRQLEEPLLFGSFFDDGAPDARRARAREQEGQMRHRAVERLLRSPTVEVPVALLDALAVSEEWRLSDEQHAMIRIYEESRET